MARAPRAKVSSTSGQGISRLAYQKAYRMKGGLTARFSSGTDGSGQKRGYSKDGGDMPESSFNVSYGDTYFPTDLKDIEAVAARKPSRASVGLGRQKAKQWRK